MEWILAILCAIKKKNDKFCFVKFWKITKYEAIQSTLITQTEVLPFDNSME